MKSYKQVGYHRCGPIEMLDVKIPSKLGHKEILVKVSAAALNPIDLLLYNTHRLFTIFKRGQKGMGRDFSGVVEDVGSEVSKFVKGDKVSGIFEKLYTKYGSFGEYLVLSVDENKNIGVIPSNLSMIEAAAFPLVFGTAYTTLTHFKDPKLCDNVLVIGGATSVGTFLIQLLKKVHGVKKVVSVNSTDSIKRVEGYGADIIVDYKKGDVKQQILDVVQDIGKFDLIVDCVGNNYLFDCINEVLKPKIENSGYVSIVGSSIGDYTSAMTQFLSYDNIKLFLFPKSWNFKMSAIEEGTWYDYGRSLFEEGKLDIPIDSVFEFKDYEKAIDKLRDHKAQGKVLLSFE